MSSRLVSQNLVKPRLKTFGIITASPVGCELYSCSVDAIHNEAGLIWTNCLLAGGSLLLAAVLLVVYSALV